MIKLKDICVSYQQKRVLNNLSIDFHTGEFCALLGPNGAGKSTLLRSIIDFQLEKTGEVYISGKEFNTWSRQELARQIAIIPQDFQLQFDYTIEDLVLMGRFPYLGRWQNYSKNDKKIVQHILAQLDLVPFKNKLYSQLSGGERRRVSIARALAQETQVLLMDEAFANLDINHQLEIMQLLSDINMEHNKLIILVSHNINLASEYCERIIMLKEGVVIADGKPEKIVNSENLKELYNAELEIIKNPVSGKPNLIYPGKNAS